MLNFRWNMKVEVRKLQSGERYVFLLDDLGLPDFWVTHFVSQRLRMNHASTSIQQYLKDIRHFKLWETLNSRDLLEDIYKGKLPTRSDVRDIQEHCRYQAKVFKQQQVNDKVIDMGQFYLSKAQDKPTVGLSQFKNRIAHIAEFLHFIGQERVKHKPAAVKLLDDLDDMKKQLVRKLPKARLKKVVLDRSAVSDDAFEDFVEVSRPNSPLNPFKDRTVQFRNYLIVQTLYESGIRCSELLALRISDIGASIDDPRLFVVRRHDSKEDPRAKEPTAKTLGRGIPISHELRELLYVYVKQHRSRTTRAKTHPFIFVGHKEKKGSYDSGEPIVQRSVNALFNRIRDINVERFIHITPHSYRHFFNDQLSARIDEMKEQVSEKVKRLEIEGRCEEAKQYANESTITEQRELEIRAELNGHSSLDSGAHYLKRTAIKQSTRIRNEMHKTLKHKAGGFNYDS